MHTNNPEDYIGARIERIHWNRDKTDLHAVLVNRDGELLISATLDYINEALQQRLPK